MAKATLTVKTDVGTFTRTTARTYTHIVVSRDLSEARICREYAAELIYAQKKEAEYAAVVAGGPMDDPRYEWQRPEFPGYLAGVRESIRTSSERLNARLNQAKAVGHGVLGWAGRLDLAEKVAAKAKADEYVDVRIYALDGSRVR